MKKSDKFVHLQEKFGAVPTAHFFTIELNQEGFALFMQND